MGDARSYWIGYKHVSEFGFPLISGKYLLVIKDQLRVADLEIINGIRKWMHYPPGIQIDESSILKWKPLPGELRDFVFGQAELSE